MVFKQVYFKIIRIVINKLLKEILSGWKCLVSHSAVNIVADVLAFINAQIIFIANYIANQFTDSRIERFVTHWVWRGPILFVFWKFRIDCGRLQQRNRIRVESGNITASRVRMIMRLVSNHWQGGQTPPLPPTSWTSIK